jgi:hypothetical protein
VSASSDCLLDRPQSKPTNEPRTKNQPADRPLTNHPLLPETPRLQQLLVGVSILQEFTPRARDSLVSFGERLSTRLFAAYLNAQGVPARQLDAPEVGLITNDAFQNAEVNYAQSLPNLRAALALAPGAPRVVQVLTGFLGRGAVTGAVTTLGRGGSDLTATLVGAALGLDEVTVWKDVDGVLTSDPRVVDDTRPVARLTYEEATELAFFGGEFSCALRRPVEAENVLETTHPPTHPPLTKHRPLPGIDSSDGAAPARDAARGRGGAPDGRARAQLVQPARAGDAHHARARHGGEPRDLDRAQAERHARGRRLHAHARPVWLPRARLRRLRGAGDDTN